ncbi:hypothetical protein F2Q68_00039998 [Brassica cretica]|uniref:Uncharacterized protein n=1 Tax=Brassica cretica TaxID=69181 RepID=A0A8S9M9A8_BRACR|nr:hypothetical protein F2Q68_00039998 [Brassica cretica]
MKQQSSLELSTIPNSLFPNLQEHGRTQTLGSPIRERSRSPLEGTPSSVPGTELPSKKCKTSDKENLPYF